MTKWAKKNDNISAYEVGPRTQSTKRFARCGVNMASARNGKKARHVSHPCRAFVLRGDAQVGKQTEQVNGDTARKDGRNGSGISITGDRHTSGSAQTRDSGMTEGVTAIIDYLSVTFPAVAEDGGLAALEKAQRLFGDHDGQGWRPMNHGGYYYARCQRRGEIGLFHGGNGDGVHVQLRGAGCRQVEAERHIVGEEGWREFLSELLAEGARVSRIDFAFDERRGLLDLDEIKERVTAGECATRFRVVNLHEQFRPSDGHQIGNGVRFGERSSPVSVKFYDKAMEQANSRRGDDESILGNWVRVEVETRDAKAETFVREFIMGGFTTILSDLGARITFRERGERRDTNKARWPMCAWWRAFLAETPRTLITAPHHEGTMAEKANMIARMSGPWLAAIVEAPGFGREWLEQTLAAAQARLQPRHIDLLAVSCAEHHERELISRGRSVALGDNLGA